MTYSFYGRSTVSAVDRRLVSMGITAIIPVRNGARTIAACVSALLAAAPDAVLVVDDASTDDTARIARTAGARVLPNTGLPGPSGARNTGAAAAATTDITGSPGPAGARNTGAGSAAADILFFVDADVLVRPDAVERIRRALADEHVGAVFGSYDVGSSTDSFISQYKNLQHHYVHQQARTDSGSFWAGCGAIRRAVYERIGGFDAARYPRPSIEDIEIGQRLHEAGVRVRLLKDLQVTHLKRWTFLGLVRTDIVQRAVPWSRLIVERGGTTDLNLAVQYRASAVLVWLSAILVATAVGLPGLRWASLGVLAGALVGLAALSADFYSFVRRERSWALLLLVVPLHWLYYAYSSATFVVVALSWPLVRRLAASSRARAA
jgi:GT2 family glycosyltransferase